MRLTVLGSCATFPGPARACSGYLLEAADRRVWIDQGSGTLANLLRYTRLLDLDAIWLSHLHADHVSDLPVAVYALRYGESQPVARRVPLFGPPGWAEHIEAFLPGDRERADRADELAARVDSVLEPHELEDGAEIRLGELELEAVETVHNVTTFGVRATAPGVRLGYSADSGPCDALKRLAAGSDLFVCEAALPEPTQEEMRRFHLTARQAAEHARDGGARRLLLTHIRWTADRARAAAEASEVFGSTCSVALEGDVYDAGRR